MLPEEYSRAAAHIVEAIHICDRLGEGLAAAHLQLGLDTILGAHRARHVETAPFPADGSGRGAGPH